MATVDELVAVLRFQVKGESDARKFESILERIERRGRSSGSSVARAADANTRALRRQAEEAQRHASVIERANQKAAAAGGLGGMALGVGRRLLPGLAAGALIKETLGAAISVEKSLAEVQKFYNLSDSGLAKMKGEIFDMVAELGKAPEAIAEVYARAGQQNVPIDKVRDYARDVTKIAVAWDMTEKAAAEGLGTIKSSLGLSQVDLVKMAGTINTLADGMEGPVAESDLLDYLSRVAGTAKALGGSAKSALSVGAALRSSGEDPAVAATTFNSIMTKLASADRGSKGQIAGYKELGFNPDKLSKDMRTNADVAFRAFFGRIREMQGKGKNVIGPIAQIFGTEYSDNILKFVNSIELYDRAMAMVADNGAAVENLDRTYKIFSKTTSANIDKMWANLTVTGDVFGTDFLPALNGAIDRINKVLMGIREIRAELPGMGADWSASLLGSGKEKEAATQRINDRYADSVVGGGGFINGVLSYLLPSDQKAAAEKRLAYTAMPSASANSRVDGAFSGFATGSPVADVSSFLDPASQAHRMAMDLNTTFTAKFTADISDIEAKVARAKELIGGVPSLSTGSFTGARTPARIAGAGAAP